MELLSEDQRLAKLNDHKLDKDEFLSFYNTMNTYTDLQLEEKLKYFVPEFQWQHSKVILENKADKEG